jgi:hypothetical protein
MALTADDLAALRNADQRFRAKVALFPALSALTIVPPAQATAGTGTLLAPKPMIMLSPRYSTVDNGGTREIYAGDSYVRGGGAAGTKNWATDVGTLDTATGDTVVFTAPGSGSGIATITVTCSNAAGESTSYALVQYPSTTYDEVVSEIASIQGSLSQHGWRMTLRCRGNVTDFTLNRRVLLHVDDTWAGTVRNFGGYRYPEGTFLGYISDLQQFEDGAGDTWLGVELSPPWYLLGRAKMGEVWWGATAEGGKLYIADFAPVDSIWKFLQDITNFSQHHNALMWFDQNHIDDFITEESDLATLVEDIAARTLSIAYCDRYGSLFVVPDPDVRAQEFWGTPASTYVLTPEYVMSYNLKRLPYQTRKLTLAAFDSSKLGIYAVSENPTAPGDDPRIRGLLCDRPEALASWAVDKRAQMNRQWILEAEHPLNRVLDLNNFVDVVFTSPTLVSGLTASGQAYAEQISYRPDIQKGGWETNIRYLQRMKGLGAAETGGTSGWGGSGGWWSGRAPFTGSGWWGSGTGGWTSGSGDNATWCFTFVFASAASGWTILKPEFWSGEGGGGGGVYVAGLGFSSQPSLQPNAWVTGAGIGMKRSFSTRTLTGLKMWGSAYDTDADTVMFEALTGATFRALTDPSFGGNAFSVADSLTWEGSVVTNAVWLRYTINHGAGGHTGGIMASAQLAGLGANPFGVEDNC